jgi:cell division protein ZapD
MKFEFPANEKTRNFLRLETLYSRLEYYLSQTNVYTHHSAILTMFEILEAASRTDIKTDILQEIERQKIFLAKYQDHPNVSVDVLQEEIDTLQSLGSNLLAQHGKFGQSLRENEWLMSLKQRSAIPAGMCPFDLPGYYVWQHMSSEARCADLLRWTEPMMPTWYAIRHLLRLLRESAWDEEYTASKGCMQYLLQGQYVHLVTVEYDLPKVWPELSANKHLISTRFMHMTEDGKHRQLSEDIPFKMALCRWAG